MEQLFFHHVGPKGAERHFPKTINKKILLEDIELLLDEKSRDKLNKIFSDKCFNVWGAPSGAKNTVSKMNVNDYILLVTETGESGFIPILGQIKYILKDKNEALSRTLWGDNNFPYIFMFDKVDIQYSWKRFINDVGYKNNFRPAGQMYRVLDERIKNIDEFIKLIANTHFDKIANGISQPDFDEINHIIKSKNLTITEKERLIKARVGQGEYRKKVLELYNRTCVATGVNFEKFLIASHIKPWSKSTNKEKLDPYNGLLLSPNIDALFDKGYISFSDEGTLLVSALLNQEYTLDLNINHIKLFGKSKKYMKYHREKIFKY